MGYSLTEIQLKALEHMHGLPGQEGDVSDVETHLGSGLLAQLEHLADAGLLRRAIRGDGFYHLTPTGQAEVEAMLERRDDRSYRRTECREALLAWIDNNTEPDRSTQIALDNFTGGVDGIEFTQRDVDLAAGFLARSALINTEGAYQRTHIWAYVTEKGQECVDQGDGIAAFLDKPRTTAGGLTQNVVVNGSGNNIAAAAGENNQVTAMLEEFDLDKARAQADAIRQALPALEEIKDEIVPLLDQIHTEDRGLAQKATLTLYQLLSGTGTGALGGALALPLAQALGLA